MLIPYSTEVAITKWPVGIGRDFFCPACNGALRLEEE